MRAESLGKWIVVSCAMVLATGCTALTPLTGRGVSNPQGARTVAGPVGQDPSSRVRSGEATGAASSDADGDERLRHRRPQRMPSAAAVGAHDMAVLAAETGMLEVDAFEKLLVHAGLDPTEDLPVRVNPLTPDEAARVLGLLLNKPLTLGNFPPRMGASLLLREVLEGGEVSREELLRRVARFTHVAVLRPDGSMAWVRNGATQQSVAPVEFKEGALVAYPFELGRFYSGRGGAFPPPGHAASTSRRARTGRDL